MIVCETGDVVLVRFPFVEIDQTKKRPALALNVVRVGKGPGLVTIAMITSKIDGLALAGDVPLEQWRATSLLHPSIVRLSKIATVDYRLVEKRLGKLHDSDRRQIRKAFAELFQSWM